MTWKLILYIQMYALSPLFPRLFACSCSLEDIPVATQCASTSPESTNEKSKPIEDEDAEPELVYPEVGCLYPGRETEIPMLTLVHLRMLQKLRRHRRRNREPICPRPSHCVLYSQTDYRPSMACKISPLSWIKVQKLVLSSFRAAGTC